MNRRSVIIRRQSGSALIITVLFITVIAAISFAVSTLSLSEFRQVGKLYDSIAAYYAAEAGLEHGLMQYRLWRDAEISKEYYAKLRSDNPLANVDYPTSETGTAQAYSLTSDQPFIQDNAADRLGTAWYGLKMWYRGSHIGNVDSQGRPVVGDKSPQVKKDSAVQIAIPNGADSAFITWEAINGSEIVIPQTTYKYFVEFNVTSALHNVIKRQIITDNQNTFPGPNAIDINIPQPLQIRFKPWNMQKLRYSLVFKDGNDPLNFDTGYTYIESSGTVGKSRRKLKVGLDRISGTIIEASDFLLFSGEYPINIGGGQ